MRVPVSLAAEIRGNKLLIIRAVFCFTIAKSEFIKANLFLSLASGAPKQLYLFLIVCFMGENEAGMQTATRGGWDRAAATLKPRGGKLALRIA